MATIQDIKQRAQQVKDATQIGENTANRVGGVLVDMADHLEQDENQLSSLYPADATPTAGSTKPVQSGSVHEQLSQLLPMDEVPTPNSVKPVQSGGMFSEVVEQIMAQFGGRFGVKNITDITTATTVTSVYFGDIVDGRTTIIAKSSSAYRVIYRNEIIKKGTVVHFTGNSSTERAQYYGATQIEPSENIVGMELDHCYVKVANGQHDDWFLMPYDGYFFYAFYNQNWSNRNFDVVEPTDEILAMIENLEGQLSETNDRITDVAKIAMPITTPATEITSTRIDKANINDNGVIIAAPDSTYRVYFYTRLLKKGTVYHFNRKGSQSRRKVYGFTTTDPSTIYDPSVPLGGFENFQLDNVTIKNTIAHNYDIVVPYDSYMFFYANSQYWLNEDVDGNPTTVFITWYLPDTLGNEVTTLSRTLGNLTSALFPEGIYKEETIVPNSSETYNAYYREGFDLQFQVHDQYKKRLTYFPEYVVAGGTELVVRYTGLNGIIIYELPYIPLGTSPVQCISKSKFIKSTALPSNQSESFTGEVRITLSNDCRRLAFVMGWTQSVVTYPSDITNNITEIDLVVVNVEHDEQEKSDETVYTVRQASYTKYLGDSGNASLGLLHYSDLHGDDTSVKVLSKFIEDLAPFTSDIVCTGDVVHFYADPTNSYPQGSVWWQNCGLAENSLFVLGNHDGATPDATEYDVKEGSAAWDGKGKAWEFETYFEPYANELEINLPVGYDDPSSEHYRACYWHKDYADQKVRLIGIDCIHRFDGILEYDSANNTWVISAEGYKNKNNIGQELWLWEKLQETLDSSNAAYGYSVVFLCHYPLDDYDGDNKEWDDLNHEFIYNRRQTGGRMMNHRTNDATAFHWARSVRGTLEARFSMRSRNATTGSKLSVNNIANIIMQWKNAGGEYVAWISGHTHVDLMYYPTNYPELLVVVIDQAGFLRGGTPYSRYLTYVNESRRLCANFIAIQTRAQSGSTEKVGIIKIVRIGGTTQDSMLRSTKYLCYDYINKKVISEG